MTTRPTFTLSSTPSIPSFTRPSATPGGLSANLSDVNSPLLTPINEHQSYGLSVAPLTAKTRWRGVVPAGLSEFVDKNTGLLLVVSSQAFYAAMNVFVKILNKLHPPVPPLELIFVRMVITYVCCTSYMLLAGVSDPWIGPKGVRLLLIFRGFSGFFGLFGIYFSLQYLSLSDATVITFLAPTGTAIAGALLLQEKIRRADLWAALISFFGVILIARPAFIFGGSAKGEDGVTPAQRFAAVCVSLVGVFGAIGAYVTIRAIGHRAHAMHSLTSFSSQSIIASGILTLILPLLASSPSSLPTTWVIPSSSAHIGLMFLIGALGFIAQALMTFGLQRETAGRGSMGMYAQIVFAGVYDKVIFHSKTSALSVIGTILIVGSALFVALTKPSTPAAKITTADEGLATEEEGLLAASDAATAAAAEEGLSGRVSEQVVESIPIGRVSAQSTIKGTPKGFVLSASEGEGRD